MEKDFENVYKMLKKSSQKYKLNLDFLMLEMLLEIFKTSRKN